MEPIEVIALVVALITPIKLITLLKSQKLWFSKVTTKFWNERSNKTMVLSGVVALVTLIFLLQELTIIQIWATMLFAMALIVMSLAPFSKYLLQAEKNWFENENTITKGWLATITWTALSIWVIYELLPLR